MSELNEATPTPDPAADPQADSSVDPTVAPIPVQPADAAENPSPESESEASEQVNIRLDQFLQLCGVPTGGQAKLLIQGGEVTVNGEVETRRRKKLVLGDSVGCDGQIFDVGFEEE